MREAQQETVGTPLSEEIFQLNLSYLLLAQRMLAQDEKRAEVLLGINEPLASWLREASTSAIAALASSPVAIHKMRLPKQAASTVLAACNEMRWLGPIHVAMTAVEKTRGRSG
jgi:flagellar transcriptional activator FlhD